MKNIAVLGSTGSVGRQTLEVIDENKEHFRVTALAANKQTDLLLEQIETFNPEMVAVYDKESAKTVRTRVKGAVRVVCGMEGLCEAAAYEKNDLVVCAVAGSLGVLPAYSALSQGKDIALANKEAMVAAGHIINAEAKRQGARIIPVDSEHSAIFQCLYGNDKKDVYKIWLTASGGPFFGKTREQMRGITKEQALKHPNWTMGQKISIDSATLMNKGLEVIEAVMLFGVAPDQVEVVVHSQSIVHSMVEYTDGSVMAQLGVADMRLPIHVALFYPKRQPSNLERLRLFDRSLTFHRPDMQAFVLLGLAYDAIEKGGSYPLALNAANEVAVEMFLKDKIEFLDIADIVSAVYESTAAKTCATVKEVMELDREIKEMTKAYICAQYQ